MFCDTLAHVTMRRYFKSLVSRTRLSCARVPSLIPQFGSYPGLGIISVQFIRTFDLTFDPLAEHHYLQTLSDVSIALFGRCYLQEAQLMLTTRSTLTRPL